MAFSIRFSQEKNQLLKATRAVSFEEIRESIIDGHLLANIAYPSKQRPSQRMYVVKIGHYTYAVPYVINVKKNEVFLKTAYPSRALTRIYIQGGKNAKK